MATPIHKPFESDVIDIKKQSLYARLKRLFSTDVIVRNIGGKQLKIKDTDNVMSATDKNSMRDRFNRIRSTAVNAYSRDFSLSYQAARMDLFRDYDVMDMDPIISCLAPTTYVSTLDGFITIKDLAEKYPNGECFKVWSWDKDAHKLTIGNAHHPRKTGIKNVIELHLDNGEIIKCTPDHRMMLVNGTYKEAGKLSSGDSLMPFYHRINDNGYQEIKSLGKRFKPMHRYIFEDVLADTDLDGYNIHHKNHNKLDNNLNNLEKLTAVDHCKLHGISPITNGKRSEKCKSLWTNSEYKTQHSSALERWRKSDEGKKMMSEHTSILNKNRWKNDPEYSLKMAQIFSDHAKSLWNNPIWKEWKRKKHSETMKLKYANDPSYAEKTKRIGKDNGRYKDCITTESILVEGIKFDSLTEFAKSFDFRGLKFKNNQYRCQFLSRRINAAGYNGWEDYKDRFNYFNHKVTKIVDNNEVMDVYDLTVDFYENFALKQGIICSNSAFDIYSDECLTYNEVGKMLTIHSNNNNVKSILENLFDEVLNIRFNLWSWTRNMCKYGDFFLKLYITPEYGVYMVEPISAYNVERIENSDPYNKRYVKFQLRPTDTAQAEVLENYEMAHFRLMSDSNFLPYGKCIKYDSYISTEYGTKQIKDIQIGDKIWSYNNKINTFELTSVKNIINSGTKKLLRVRTQHNFLDVSEDHKFLVFDPAMNKTEYKIAKELKIRDLLVIFSNKNKKFIDTDEFSLDPVCKLEDGGEDETWDIQVESENSNFVANGIVVHNSMIEGARRVWKQLSLMEDAMLIHRIMRAPEKRIFYTDIGNIPPNEVDTYMQKMMDKMKKVPYMDEQTGEYNLRFNLQNMIEDYYIPVRGGDSGTKIDTIQGMEWTGTDDIEYLKNKMMAALKIPKAFLGYEEGLCVSPETQIPLLNGTEKSVKDIIEDYNKGIKNYVYSIDETTKNIVPGEIEWAGFTRKNADVVRVWLDNNKYIDCTPDHNFLTRDGNWIEASKLESGQSLMPLYSKKSNRKDRKGYEMVYHPSSGKYQEVHRLVSEHYNMIHSGAGKVVHHKDFNKLNNNPENLNCSMTYWEHRNFHSALTTIGVNSPENIAKRVNDLTWRMHTIEAGKKGGRKSAIKLAEWARTHSPFNKGIRSGINRICPVCQASVYTTKSVDKTTCSNNCAKVYFTKDKRYNSKYSSVSMDKLIESAKISKSFKELEINLGNIDRNTLSKIFKFHNIENKLEFINKYMPLALSNRGFMNNMRGSYKNHKVVRVEKLLQKIDTCDITVKQYHNFATSAGVIIHNSGKATLASEDVRFARTIQRIQRILTSELSKIAIVHLYAQGYRDESLVDFELELTNPSTIFEKEKIEIWSDKVSVATDMVENKFFSYNWIYKNIFNMSEDDIQIVKDEVVEDAKQKFRFTSIEEDGDDPAKPNSNFGNKDGGGGGGDEGDLGGDSGGGMGDLGDLGDLGGGGGESEGGPEPGGKSSMGGPEDLVKETKDLRKREDRVDDRDRSGRVQDRDSTGKHDARAEHPLTEDPLGEDGMNANHNKRSEGKKISSLTTNPERNSPLRLQEMHKNVPAKKREANPPSADMSMIHSLSEFLSKTQKETKRELIKENTQKTLKSLLDESNILE